MGPDRSDRRAVFNHVGHCVTDLERSQRFYRELLGFEVLRQISVPDQPADRLLGIAPPLGMTALYMQRDGLVLELMCFNRPGNPPVRSRPLNEPGLAHLSFSVEDVAGAASRAAELGGSVVEESNVGAAVLVRDPDGQLIELVSMAYRASLDAPAGPDAGC